MLKQMKNKSKPQKKIMFLSYNYGSDQIQAQIYKASSIHKKIIISNKLVVLKLTIHTYSSCLENKLPTIHNVTHMG